MCLWCGCTVTPSNYKLLSFFFDGVKDPSATGPGGAAGDFTVSDVVVVHKPFADENCEACHKSNYRPGRNDPSACFTCHETVADEHRWTHGAVAGGACLWCHSPHESARKWLLRGPDRKLCVQCHTATPLVSTSVPAHMDPNISCLACHFGHGGEDSLMLKPGASAAGPPVEGADAYPAETPIPPAPSASPAPAATSPETGPDAASSFSGEPNDPKEPP